MKNLTAIFIINLFACSLLAQPEWSPIGAKWKYVVTDNYDYIQENLYKCVGEELFQGNLCRVIEGNTKLYYSYEENGQTFLYNQVDSSFQIRYDFNKQAGESWQFISDQDTLIAMVDSVYTKEYGGQSFQVQLVNITDPNQPFIGYWEEVLLGIGGSQIFDFPIITGVTVDVFYGLACYFSEETGVVEVVKFPNVDIDCDVLSVGTSENSEQDIQVLLYPNPATNNINIEMYNQSIVEGAWMLYNAVGQRVLLHQMGRGGMETISFTEVPPGIYFWEMRSIEGKLGIGKLIISK
jgi:hypothetical protein